MKRPAFLYSNFWSNKMATQADVDALTVRLNAVTEQLNGLNAPTGTGTIDLTANTAAITQVEQATANLAKRLAPQA